MDGVCVLMIAYYRWEAAPFYTLNTLVTLEFRYFLCSAHAYPIIQSDYSIYDEKVIRSEYSED
jgi:hypothetical protein